MKHSSLIVTSLVLVIAITVWFGIFFFVRKVHADQVAIGRAVDAARAENLSEDSLKQMTSVLTTTEVGRAQVANLVHEDLLALTGRVVAAGSDAGVELHVSNATAIAPPVQPKGAPSQLSSVRLTVEGSGNFAKLMHALMLIENLPVPSRVDAVSFYHNTADSESPWHMKIDVNIATALPISL